MDAKIVGENMRRERVLAGLMQREIASLLKVRCSSVSGWELGKNMPGFSVLCQFASELGIPLERIATGEVLSPNRQENTGTELDIKALGKRIRAQRESLGMTQRALAHEIREFESSISQWENGRRAPSLVTAKNIVLALNWSFDSFFGMDTDF